MGRTVILRHTLPDGTWHYDWLLERVEGEERLATFRTMDRPDDEGCGAFRAERLGDHRAAYLVYEGVVSGGRGSVERVAEGVCRVEVETEGRIEVVVRFGDGPERRWVGRRGEDGGVEAAGVSWEFRTAGL